MRKSLRIGLIGTGFMGKAHALSYQAAGNVFDDISRPVLHAVVDIDGARAAQFRNQFGFAKAMTDWQELVQDPEIDVVSITTPTLFHKEMALAAIAAGKHVHCEKPLAISAADAQEMMLAAEQAGVRTASGFNYLKNPLLRYAREMIASGELGEITDFNGIHAEGFMSDPQTPWSWRCDPAGGQGAIADVGSHIIAIARYLMGPVTQVFAQLDTPVASRPVKAGASERKPVGVDDIARMIVSFERGCSGVLQANWLATGRNMQLAFQISGSKGSLVFDQQRMNELQYFKAGEDPRSSGFRLIESGPQHPPYGAFCVAGGHHLGFNDLKTIEMAEFIRAIDRDEPASPDFREAWEVQRLIDAAVMSHKDRAWLTL
ncbi:Gfo/Idh/MocA family protein [Asaia lannensis]|uniref:Gfo/Idh/MocA family oxidoreductase n=1 Tax=Asaia lannensis NBRC 102526 TaxID=1307926 RepID=A0ABT1CCZ3_9PROT|nr:Gfo/Idh/MocA family oxidoreductase [Asaia lannensis]MCO6158732.1 Gfo/Idh/MocA family oxidoreductase [Asaia lannensis NBRC 102526]GBR00358.1 putative dehydrogenase [Asaia lannensis NBRC 102526]